MERSARSMTAKSNKELYRRVVEDLNRGDLESSLEFTAPDATLNGQPLGREGDKHRAEMLATAFPDQHYELQEMVAEGNMLVVRWRMTGTHKGELAGPTMTIPATGKRLDIWGMSMYRIEDGMAKEIWERFDMMEFLGQLGVLPPPGQSGEASPTSDAR
jgi:predicted ester cyclase